MTEHDIQPGDVVRILDAHGDWHDAKAITRAMRGDRFPVIWIEGTNKNGEPYEAPWPIESVRAAAGLGKPQ